MSTAEKMAEIAKNSNEGKELLSWYDRAINQILSDIEKKAKGGKRSHYVLLGEDHISYLDSWFGDPETSYKRREELEVKSDKLSELIKDHHKFVVKDDCLFVDWDYWRVAFLVEW